MEIIWATDSHIPEIVELWKQFMDFHKNIDASFARNKEAHLNFRKYVTKLIKSNNFRVVVASEKRHIIAFCIAGIGKYPPVFRYKTYGAINTIIVKSSYRRKGIGERMLAKIFEWFESRKIDRIELAVLAQNQIGYRFWNKQGFKAYKHILYMNKQKRPISRHNVFAIYPT